MKTNILFLCPVMLILFLSAISFGQNDLDLNKIPSLKQKQVKFDIALEEKIVKLGNPILLNTSIQNNFSRDISTRNFYLDDLLVFFVIEIRNSHGELLNRIDLVKPRFGSRTALELTPNEKYKTTLQLNRSFNLPVGVYSITTSFTVFDRAKNEKNVVKSNTENLTIIE